MMLSVNVVEKTKVKALSEEELVHEYEMIINLEKVVREIKQQLRQEIIARYGENAVHSIGDKKLIIQPVERNVLDTKKTKEFLMEIGRLDEFMKVQRFIRIDVK